jgi:hypothetical protein
LFPMRAWRWLLSLLVVSLATAGCSNPARPDCAYSVTLATATYASAGGNGSVVVSPAPSTPGCSWTLSSNANWLTLTGTTTGTRQTTTAYRVDANTTSATRTAKVSVSWDGPGGGGSADGTISQSGVTISPPVLSGTNPSPAAGGGNFTVNVATSGSWAATVVSSFVTITSGATGNGNGSFTYAVAANTTSSSRTATIIVTGLGGSTTFTITQAGINSSTVLSVSPTNPPAVASAGQSGLTAQVTANVAWTASVDGASTSWLSITNGSSGNGGGTLTYAVGANAGANRTGTITVSGGGATATVTVTQLGINPTLSLANPNPAIVGSAGQSGLTANVNSNLNWTATVEAGAASWLSVTGGSPGTNTGAFTYSVGPNTGAARTGLITVAGGGLSATLTVTQSAFQPSIVVGNPNPTQVAAGGQSGITASITANVSWTASVESGAASWLSITGGSPGNNNGTLTYAVAANVSVGRTGIITIAGGGATATLTVSQAAGVPFITLGNQDPSTVSANGQLSGLSVSVSSNVTWSAAVDAGFGSWLSITGASTGTNNGSIAYSVQPNTGAARLGTITFSGGGAPSVKLNVRQATGILTPALTWDGRTCQMVTNGGVGNLANKWDGCTLNASGSTGPIQTYQFFFDNPNPGPMGNASSASSISSGFAPCGYSGGSTSNVNVYVVITNGGSSAQSAPISILVAKNGQC